MNMTYFDVVVGKKFCVKNSNFNHNNNLLMTLATQWSIASGLDQCNEISLDHGILSRFKTQFTLSYTRLMVITRLI